eukprot:13889251-Alexandrium_andersonii.AAC.1
MWNARIARAARCNYNSCWALAFLTCPATRSLLYYSSLLQTTEPWAVPRGPLLRTFAPGQL